MLALLISLLISTASSIACVANRLGTAAAIACGITVFFLSLFLIGFLIRKKTEAVKNELEGTLMSGQKRIQHKIQQFQNKPGGNIKLMQRQIEQDQMGIIKQALDFTARFEPFKKWNLLMGRQIATMRLQFLYQLKEFEQVDAILAKGGLFTGPMLMEPMSVAMKMARQFKNKEIKAAEKTFKRHVKWFRGDRGTLLYALMSWIYVKDGESEKARQLLLKGKEATANQILARNWELLSNNKEKSFSNAGLGEEWYGLYLENPPAPKQKRMRGQAQGGRRF